jgi:hypothetical protein
MEPIGAGRWLTASRQAIRVAVDHLLAPAPDATAGLHLLLGSYKAVRVLSDPAAGPPEALQAATRAAALQTERLITDPADPRLLNLPLDVEESPDWRPFGNRDIITLYRAAWLLCGLRALAAREGSRETPLADALERKILAAQDLRSGGFPTAFVESSRRTFGVNPTFMVLFALLDGRPWSALSPDARKAVRDGMRFLRGILEINRRESGGTHYPQVDESGRPVTEEHPRFDRELFFLQRVLTREPIEHIWLVAGPAMAAARWARLLREAGQTEGPDFAAAVDLAWVSFDAAMACAWPLENLSVGKLVAAALDLLALAPHEPRCGRRREAVVSIVRRAADFLSGEGEVRDGGRARWYWEKYHPKRDGWPADAPCPARLTAGVLDYTVEIGYWLAAAAGSEMLARPGG